MPTDVMAKANDMGHSFETTGDFLLALREDLSDDEELLTGDDAAMDAEIRHADGTRTVLMILDGAPEDTPAIFPFDFGGD